MEAAVGRVERGEVTRREGESRREIEVKKAWGAHLFQLGLQ